MYCTENICSEIPLFTYFNSFFLDLYESENWFSSCMILRLQNEPSKVLKQSQNIWVTRNKCTVKLHTNMAALDS